MSQKTLIDRIVPYAKNWSRTGTNSIQQLVSEARDELFEYDAPYMNFIDPADNKGYPPYLLTTNEVYKYEISAANLSIASMVKTFNGTDYAVTCRRVERVFIDVTRDNVYDQSWVGRPALSHFFNPYTQQTTRLYVADIAVESYPALEDGTNAYIVFKENPGTTTTRYFVQFIWQPPPLVSEAIPLCIPKEYEKAIEDYVIGKIKRRANGKMSEDEQRFYTYWLPRFRQQVLTSGAQSNDRTTIPIPC